MNKSFIRSSISPYQVAMSAPKQRSETLHALTSDALGPQFGKCRDCHGFSRAVTRRGVVYCGNPIHRAEDKPALPMRPTPHERDGRQEPTTPAKPHTRYAVLVGASPQQR
ncbi:hypothetical protein ACIRO1_45310 [Streptomyces sp. NPDC102381]|jgi:hypothetical protein|uniref:hypothetical protein n=1 Tax=Streptomyces sp. NPDC102381 TaxID=3366164 RepID=UPI00380939F4